MSDNTDREPRSHYESGSYHQMVMGQRTVESHAVFFVPHLKEGMSLLDCGCGPGSITVGLARAVFPGPVVGIDIDESDVSKAEELARVLGEQNATFHRADVYSLPFADSRMKHSTQYSPMAFLSIWSSLSRPFER